jgi:hypothetical protein
MEPGIYGKDATDRWQATEAKIKASSYSIGAVAFRRSPRALSENPQFPSNSDLTGADSSTWRGRPIAFSACATAEAHLIVPVVSLPRQHTVEVKNHIRHVHDGRCRHPQGTFQVCAPETPSPRSGRDRSSNLSRGSRAG